MKAYGNFAFPTAIHVLALASKFKISICETPVANNFGGVPEYGQLLSSPNPSWSNNSPPTDISSASLETGSSNSDPQYDDHYQDYNSLDNDYFDHHDDYEESYHEEKGSESSEEFRNELSSNNEKNKGRGFQDASSSSLMKFLMSPLKPFSLLPSVFRRGKKIKKKRKGRRHRGRHRPPKGRRENRESEASSELRGIRDQDYEFDLHVDSSESSAGYRRKKRGRGRGLGLVRWWRGKGRGRKRRRKPKKSRPKKRPRRPKPQHDDDYYEDEDYNKIPIKVNYESDLRPHQNSFMNNDGLGFDNQPHNNKPDHHKPPEKAEAEAGTLASLFKNNFKNGFRMMKETLGRTEEERGGKFHKDNNGIPGTFWNFGGQGQLFPKSIYDKLPPVDGIFTSTTQRPYTRYIAPPNHPMRIMRPPIPPRLPPFSSENPTSYHYIAANNGSSKTVNNGHTGINWVKNDEFGTPSASFNFPEFPPPVQGRRHRLMPIVAQSLPFRPTQDETVPPPYMSAPHSLPFSAKFAIVPRRPPGVVRYLRGIGTRVRHSVGIPMGMRAPMRYLHQQSLIPIRLERGYDRGGSNFHQIPSFSTPMASFSNWHHTHLPQPQPTDFIQQEQEMNQNDAEGQSQELEEVQMGSEVSDSTEKNDMTEQLNEVKPQIIYGKWNPLLDKVGETEILNNNSHGLQEPSNNDNVNND